MAAGMVPRPFAPLFPHACASLPLTEMAHRIVRRKHLCANSTWEWSSKIIPKLSTGMTVGDGPDHDMPQVCL